MDKKRLLSSMTVVGYGLVVIFVVLAIAITIMIAIHGINREEKTANHLLFLMPEDTEEVTTKNNVTSVSTKDLAKTINFKIAGRENANGENIDYSTRKIVVTINNSSNSFQPANISETSVWFAQKNDKGELVVDNDGNYVPVSTNKVEVGVNDTITLILAITQYSDDELNPDKDAFYIKGGISHLHSQSEDSLLKAQELKVEVDVPVEKFEITVSGYDYYDRGDNSQKVDLTSSIKKTAYYLEDGTQQVIFYSNIKTITDSSDEFLNLSDTTQNHLNKTMLYLGTSTSKFENGKYYTVVNKTKTEIDWVENNDLRYFIKGTELELGINVFPKNSLSSVLDFKQATFESNLHDLANLKNPNSNILQIIGNDKYPEGVVEITATLPILRNALDKLESKILIPVAPCVVDKIETDTMVEEDGTLKPINCLLNKPMSILFNQNNLNEEDVNLGLRVIPKFYNGHNNPFDGDYTSIFAEVKVGVEEGKTVSLEDVNTNFKNLIIDLPDGEQVVDGKTLNKTIKFSTNRMLYGGEEAVLIVSGQRPFVNDYLPYVAFKIIPYVRQPKVSSNPDLSELIYRDGIKHSEQDDQSINFSVTKEDADFINITEKNYGDEALINGEYIKTQGPSNPNLDKIDITYKNEETAPIIYKTDEQSLFCKWIYFVDNPPESSVVWLAGPDGAKQLKSPTAYGTQLYALGEGTVVLTPKLVLCDKNGNCLDCTYNILSVNDDTGRLKVEDIVTTAFNDTYKNNYVVIYDPKIKQTIKVTEGMSELVFFYDLDTTATPITPKDMVNLQKGVELVPNKADDFYFIANSKQALINASISDNFETRQNGQSVYGVVNFSKVSDGYGILRLDGVSIPTGETYVRHSYSFVYMGGIVQSEFNVDIKTVSVKSVDAVFDVLEELPLDLFASDLNRIVLYVGEDNKTIKNNDGSDLVLKTNSYYVVKSATNAAGTYYYWVEGEDEPGFEYNSLSGLKTINLKEKRVGSQNKVGFYIRGVTASDSPPYSIEDINLPKNPHYSINFERAHGNENVDVDSVGRSFEQRIVVLNDPISVPFDPGSAPSDNSESDNSDKIKVQAVDGNIRLALFEGWETEIASKHVYLVYVMKIGEAIVGVDTYKIKFTYDIDPLNNKPIGVSALLSDSVNMLYLSQDGSDTESTGKLSKTDGGAVVNIKSLFSVKNTYEDDFGATQVEDFNINGTSIVVKLLGAGVSNLNNDYSAFFSATVSDSGVITFTAGDGYEITPDAGSGPIDKGESYKLRFMIFGNENDSCAFFATDINVTLSFSVVQKITPPSP